MQTGSVGRGAQGWPPPRFAGYRPWLGECRPELLDPNQVNQQALMKVEIEIRESRFAPAHFGYGDVVIACVLAFARMFVLRCVWMVHMRVVPVAVQPLGVEMHAPRTADMAVGAHVHVQAAELNGKEAYACGDRRRVSQMAHG